MSDTKKPASSIENEPDFSLLTKQPMPRTHLFFANLVWMNSCGGVEIGAEMGLGKHLTARVSDKTTLDYDEIKAGFRWYKENRYFGTFRSVSATKKRNICNSDWNGNTHVQFTVGKKFAYGDLEAWIHITPQIGFDVDITDGRASPHFGISVGTEL